MKKGKVNVYQLNNDGEYVIESENVDYVTHDREERINELSFDQKNETDGLPEDVYKVLHTNPFLYIKKDEYKNYILSIEDFYISYKNLNISLGEALRSERFNLSQKKKIFVNQFKTWKSDANMVVKDTFKEFGENLQVSRGQNIVSLNFGQKFGLIAGLIIPAFLLLNIVPWLSITNIVLKYIAYVIMGLSVIGITLFSIRSYKINKQKKHEKFNKKVYNKYYKEILRDLKNKSEKVSNYYVKNLSKKTFFTAPAPIDSILIGGEKVEYAKKENEAIKDKCMEILKTNEGFNWLYHIPAVLSIVTWIPSIGYLVYLLVLKLVDYLR